MNFFPCVFKISFTCFHRLLFSSLASLNNPYSLLPPTNKSSQFNEMYSECWSGGASSFIEPQNGNHPHLLKLITGERKREIKAEMLFSLSNNVNINIYPLFPPIYLFSNYIIRFLSFKTAHVD